MARNLTPEEQQKLLDIQKEQDEISQRIEERNKRIAVAGQEEIKRLEKRNQKDREHLKNLEQQSDVIQEIKDDAEDYADFWKDAGERLEEYNKLQDDLGNSFTKLNPRVKQILTTSNNSGNQLAAITNQILDLKHQTLNADELTKAALDEQIKSLTSVRQELIDQAEALVDAKDSMFGITDAQRRREEFESENRGLSEENYDIAYKAFLVKENMVQQQERLNELQNQANGLINQLPEGLQSALTVIKDMAKGLAAGLGPIVLLGALLGAALVEFTEIEEAAGNFRKETGLTNSQTKEIQQNVKDSVHEFRDLGLTAEEAYKSIAALKDAFSDSTQLSKAVQDSVSLMGTQFAIAAKDAAMVNQMFQSIGGFSAETAAGLSIQTAELANQVGIAPAKVFEDIADASEETYKYFKGNAKEIAKQAIEARRLGTNLKSVLKTTEGLLNFEEGIEKELVAATFLGGQFSLSQARALAYAGKQVDAQKEVLRQVERYQKFADMDPFTKQAVADAVNMTVDELGKQIMMQRKLTNLSDAQAKLVGEAMENGLDITNLNEAQLQQKVHELEKQKEIVDQVANLDNAFKGVVAQVGGALMPIFEALAPIIEYALKPITWAAEGIKMVVDGLKEGKLGAIALVSVLTMMSVKSIISAIGAIFTGFGALGPFGVALAGLAVAGMMSSINKAKDIGDMSMESANKGGRATITTAEGQIFRPSKNDQIAIGPNTVDRLSKASTLGKVAALPFGGGAASAAIDVLVSEMKQLRQDMNNGKIRANAYLDGQKVMSGIAVASETSGKNNFTYGQRV